MKKRPQENEYNSYYNGYITLVQGNNILENLEKIKNESLKFYRKIEREKWEKPYAPNKWTLKEMLIHLIDTERVMVYRALRVSRNDKTPLPGFDQDFYAPNSNANKRSIESILKEYEMVRNASISLFENLSEEMFSNFGTASEAPITPLALAYIIAGHDIHHQNITKEKYL